MNKDVYNVATLLGIFPNDQSPVAVHYTLFNVQACSVTLREKY